MPVLLSCGLCQVKAVDGILSRSSWGHVPTNPHGELHACPVCLEKYPNEWKERLLEANPEAAAGTAPAKKKDPWGRS